MTAIRDRDGNIVEIHVSDGGKYSMVILGESGTRVVEIGDGDAAFRFVTDLLAFALEAMDEGD